MSSFSFASTIDQSVVYFSNSPQFQLTSKTRYDLQFVSNAPQNSISSLTDSDSLWNKDNWNTEFSCKDLAEKIAKKSPGKSILVVDCVVKRDFPAEFADIAKKAGFDGVFWVSNWNSPGYEAKSLWSFRDNSFEVPVLEISKNSEFAKMNPRPSAIDLGADWINSQRNPYQMYSWIGIQTPILLALGVLSIFKIIHASGKLKVHLAASTDGRPITPSSVVLLLEILASIICIIALVDFQGQFHLYSFEMWNSLLFLLSTLTFLSTLVLAYTLISVESTLFGENFVFLRQIVLLVSSMSYVFVNLAILICHGCKIFDHPYLQMSGSIFSVAIQLFIGFYFLVTKSKMMGSIKKMAASVAATSRDRSIMLNQSKGMQRNFLYLYFSGITLILFVGLSIVKSVMEFHGQVEAMIYFALFSQISNASFGLFQVLSLPEKLSAKSTTASDPHQIISVSTIKRKSSTFVKPSLQLQMTLLQQAEQK